LLCDAGGILSFPMVKSTDLQGEPDDTLIQIYQADREGVRGRQAVSVLFERWRLRVYQWARRVVREHESALDIAQDCLLQAFEALPRYQARGRFSAWLFTIVHNRCLSAVRRRPLAHDPEVDTDLLASQSPAPDEAYADADQERRMMERIDEVLEPRERTALWLRTMEGMSVDEITRLLDVDGASGARGLLQTARRKLRASIEREPGGGTA
jgi:RNA polymerase sigma-70 factor, ECF subfamily